MTTLNLLYDSSSVTSAGLLHSFNGSGSSTPRMIGVEGEFFIVQPDSLDFVRPDQIASILNMMSACGFNLQTEACGVVEINSPPFKLDEIGLLYAFCDEAEQRLKSTVYTAGYHILPTSVHPFESLKSALGKVVDRPRVRDMIHAMRNLPPHALQVGLMTASAQVSTNYKDPEDLYKILHRGYALSPLFISLFGTDTGRLMGRRFSQHIRSHLYQAYGENAHGIPSYLADCCNGEQLIQRHLDAVSATNLLYHFNGNEVVIPSSVSAMSTFKKLSERGLGTYANHIVAESFFYTDIKFKPLPDDKRRIEFRLPDTGPEHMKMAAAIVAVLVCQPETASVFDQILQRFGFKGTFVDDLQSMIKNRNEAILFPGCRDIPFGNRMMTDVCQSIHDEILPMIDRTSETRDLMSRLFCHHHHPQTLVYRQMDTNALINALSKPKHC